MPQSEHLEILKKGAGEWNKWRQSNSDTPIDLSNLDFRELGLGVGLTGVDFSGVNLFASDLSGVELKRADLAGANLASACLVGADLSGADLRQANLASTDVAHARLHEANLRGTDLTKAVGFQAAQLGGTLTSLAKLPEAVKGLEAISVVKDASANARKIFLAMLLGCAYAMLTIATTTDARLLTNSATSPLPIIQAQIPIVGFYVATPAILLGFYLYFHLCMRNIWQRLATLPAELPDGRSLDKAADPWLLIGLVRAHFKRLRNQRLFLDHLQSQLSVFLAWWVVPTTLVALWWRYLRRHEALVTTWQIFLLLLAVVVGIYSYKHAISTLKGDDKSAFSLASSLKSWRRYVRSCVVTVSLALVCSLLSAAAIRDWRWSEDEWGMAGLLEVRDLILNADISNSDLSTKPVGWNGGTGADADQIKLVKPAKLTGANLIGANGRGAFLVKADLAGANLRRADLSGADLRGADLADAIVWGTRFSGADLTDAQNLSQSELLYSCGDLDTVLPQGFQVLTLCADISWRDADLSEADLSGWNLQEADLGSADLSKADLSWTLLNRAWLRNADLSAAVLTEAVLTEADLSYATLDRAVLSNAQLVGANLTEASLYGTDLSGADLVTDGITQEQIDQACADHPVKLRPELEQPPPCAENNEVWPAEDAVQPDI